MSGCGCEVEISDRQQGRTLWILLAINAVMFVVEIVIGWLAESTGLIADSIDMLADAAVYAIAMYAVGRSMTVKITAARLSGVFQVLLAFAVIADVSRRFIVGSEPESLLMIATGLLALVANIACLVLIAKHREGEVHMRASWIFSKNDVIANLGVIVAGILVALLDSRLPDLIVGALITLLIMRGGILIIRDARSEQRKLAAASRQ